MTGTHRWMIGAMMTMAIGFGSLFVAISNKNTPTPQLQPPPQLPPIIINIPPTPAPPPTAR